MRKNVITYLMIILMFMVVASLSFEVKQVFASTLTVTETDEYVTIENDYFIANITTSAGAIQHFYIKPYTAINIVSDNGFPCLGGHETVIKDVGSQGASAQWTPSAIHSVDVSIVYETSSTVSVRSVTVWSTLSFPESVNLTVISYKTFYADQPYYLSTDSRLYSEDKMQPSNEELCFLFDTGNFWNKTSGTWFGLNRTGQAEEDLEDRVLLIESRNYEKFPWFWVSNSTTETGYGTILLDGKPNSFATTIGEVSGGGIGGAYTEYQIFYPRAYANEEAYIVTYLSVARDSTSYAYIDNLSSNLFLGQTEVYPADMHIQANNKETNPAYNWIAKTSGWRASPYATGYGWSWRTMDNKQANSPWVMINSTDTYDLIWTYADFEVTEFTYNDTCCVLNFTQTWGSLNFSVKWEAWNNSDTVKMTHTLKTIDSSNITDAYLSQYSGASDWYWVGLDNEHMKLNRTDPEIATNLLDEGYIVKNLTNTERVLTGAISKFFWINNVAEQEYASGQVWTIELYIQYFRRYSWQELGYFGVSDFSEPLSGTTEINDNLNLEFWLPAPVFGQESDLRLLRISDNRTGFYAIVDSSFSSDKLTLISVGESGSSATIQIYCGSKGEPREVTGATSWSYNSITKICTLSWIHSSVQSIVVDWMMGSSGGLYSLRVHVTQNKFPYFGGFVEVDGENKTTNLLGDVVFNVEYGTHQVVVYCGDKQRKRTVMMNRDKTIGFNFEYHPPKDRGLMLVLFIPLGLIVVVAVIFFNGRRKS